MRISATKRAAAKRESQERILQAAARRLRAHGLQRMAIVPVMRDAGLTHGAFYSHFDDKDDMAAAALAHAITAGRPRWIKPAHGESWPARLTTLTKRYLTAAHRDDRAGGCAFAALSSEAAHASPRFRATFERELRVSLTAMCGGEQASADRQDDAIAVLAMCVGALSLSRAVADPTFSDTILRAARQAAAHIAR